MENYWHIESFKNLDIVESNFQIHGQVLEYFHASKSEKNDKINT